MAKVTKTPILFVVDAKGMGRSLLPLLAGFLHYDKEHLIRGVLLNRISKGYYETIKPLIEEELKVPVIGFLPEKKEMHMESRYLGLFMPDESMDIKAKLETVSERFLETVSMEDIITIAENAKAIQGISGHPFMSQKTDSHKEKEEKPVIAVARDEAFCFYYADNIRMLKENGAEITYFSPLHDEKLPEGCHALLLGQRCFLPEGEGIKGHEFHYYDSTDHGACAIAKKPMTGRVKILFIFGRGC